MIDVELSESFKAMNNLVQMNINAMQEENAERDKALELKQYKMLDFLRTNHAINGIVRIETELLGLASLITGYMERQAIHETKVGCTMNNETNDRHIIFDLPVIKTYKKGKREINVTKDEFQKYISNYPRQLTLKTKTEDSIEKITYTDESINTDVAVQFLYKKGSWKWSETGDNQEYVVVSNYEELFDMGGDT